MKRRLTKQLYSVALAIALAGTGISGSMPVQAAESSRRTAAAASVSSFRVVNSPVILDGLSVTPADLGGSTSEKTPVIAFDVSDGNDAPSITYGTGTDVSWKVNGRTATADSSGSIQLPGAGKYKVVAATTAAAAGTTSSSALYVVNLKDAPKKKTASLGVATPSGGFRFSKDLAKTLGSSIYVRNVSSSTKVSYQSKMVYDGMGREVLNADYVDGLPDAAGVYHVRAVVGPDLVNYYLPQETAPVMLTVSRSEERITYGRMYVSSQEIMHADQLPINLSKYAASWDDLKKGTVEITGNAAKLISGVPEITSAGELQFTLDQSAVEKQRNNVVGRLEVVFTDLNNCALELVCDFVVTPYKVVILDIEQEDGEYGKILPKPEVTVRETGTALDQSGMKYSYKKQNSTQAASKAPDSAGSYVVTVDYSAGTGDGRIVGSASTDFTIEKRGIHISPDLTAYANGIAADKADNIGYTLAIGDKLAKNDKFGVEPVYKVDPADYTGVENTCRVIAANKEKVLEGLTNADSYELIFDEDQTVLVFSEGLVIKFIKEKYVYGENIDAVVRLDGKDVTKDADITYSKTAASNGTAAGAAQAQQKGLPSQPGVYTVYAKYGTDTAKASIEITNNLITITPKDVTVEKGSEMPVFEYDVDGISDPGMIASEPVFKAVTGTEDAAITDTLTAGTYKIVVDTPAVLREGENCQLSYGTGTLTITDVEPPEVPGTSDGSQSPGSIAGAAVAGTVGLDGIFRDSDGKVIANGIVRLVNGSMYVTNGKGNMRVSQFVTDADENLYYVTDSGEVAVDRIVTVNGNRYCGGRDGVIIRGAFYTLTDGRTVHAGADGILAENKIFTAGNKKYHADKDCAVSKSVIVTAKNGKKYYAGADGAFVAEKVFSLGGKKYYANGNGVIVSKKFCTAGGKRYYANAKGVIVRSRMFSVGGKKYYANAKGVVAVKKFFSYGSSRYYAGAKGVIVRGKMFSVLGRKYYAKKNGSIAANELVKAGGKQYYADAKGCFYTNVWIQSGSRQYYCSKSGVITKTKKAE